MNAVIFIVDFLHGDSCEDLLLDKFYLNVVAQLKILDAIEEQSYA